MFGSQTIEHPFGLSVYGSSIIRVEPDVASIQFSASCIKKKPAEAFADVRTITKNVTAFLAEENFTDFGVSRILLEETREFVHGERKFIGYSATTKFHLILRELDKLEGLLVGIVGAGVNEIESVQHQIKDLKGVRATARAEAVASATGKAQIYCKAADVKLGSVIHITDINPESLSERSSHGTKFRQVGIDSGESIKAFNPGAVEVGAAVLLGFKIGD